MRILVTAFDPFGEDVTNSSMMTLDRLSDKIGNIEIVKLVVPTVFYESYSYVWEKAMENEVDAILSLGQAGTRGSVTVEKVGINYAMANIGDNKGVCYDGTELVKDGPDAIFSTLPVKEMVNGAREKGYSVNMSFSAGAFVCNSLLYLLLKRARDEKRRLQIGFVHIPYIKEQGKTDGLFECNEMAECVEEMIKIIGSLNIERTV